MRKKKQNLKEEDGQKFLVQHRKCKKKGLLISPSKIHKDFFLVLCEGSLEEWYIDSIDELK